MPKKKTKKKTQVESALKSSRKVIGYLQGPRLESGRGWSLRTRRFHRALACSARGPPRSTLRSSPVSADHRIRHA